jgi:glycosyltransferase involved in cell wall biosynthesis
VKYSIIIPVYNRPEEVEELLASLSLQTYKKFEVIVVEDGSQITCKGIVDKYEHSLNIFYFEKPNSGPGLTRNFGAERANGEFFIFFDSDCIIPPNYFNEVDKELTSNKFDAFGGPDQAHPSFTNIQKAINYSMTSFFTTGGIRGGKHKLDKFHPRSFNMGISRVAFLAIGGFTSMRFGEDVDLSLRLIQNGFKTELLPNAFVYHKRRTDFRKFFRQVFNSGKARINLHLLHRGSLKIVHLLPTAFVLGMMLAIITSPLLPCTLLFPIIYSVAVFLHALIIGNSLVVSIHSIGAAWVQLVGYGTGFIAAFWKRVILKQKDFKAFETTFYK